MDLGEIAMKGYSAFRKAPALLEPHHQIVYCHKQDSHWGGSYSSTEMQRCSRCILLSQPTGLYDFSANSLGVTLFLNESQLICLHTFKWFQVLLFNSNNLMCTQFNSLMYFSSTLIVGVLVVLTVKPLDCGFVVIEFELQSRYYVHFRTNTSRERYEPPYPPILRSTTIVFLEGWIWPKITQEGWHTTNKQIDANNSIWY